VISEDASELVRVIVISLLGFLPIILVECHRKSMDSSNLYFIKPCQKNKMKPLTEDQAVYVSVIILTIILILILVSFKS